MFSHFSHPPYKRGVEWERDRCGGCVLTPVLLVRPGSRELKPFADVKEYAAFDHRFDR